MSEPVTTIVAALIGAVLGSGGAVLIQYLLTSRSEKLHRREILIQRYLFQLQDALEMLWYRLDNLANNFGRAVMSEEYFVKTTLYVLGRVLALERIFMLEAVYPQLDTIYPGLGKWLKQNRFDLNLLGYLEWQTFDFYQYDRFLLAEAVIIHEGDVFRTATYLEAKRGYEEKEALEKEWIERAKQVILSFDDEQNRERVNGLLDTLIAIAKYIENRTGIDSSLTKKPGALPIDIQ
jgi:hypothetical protein